MPVDVKICGISEPESLQAAVQAGARFVGFVFFERSPRFVAAPMAAELARQVGTAVRTVGLFVEPSDDFLDHVVTQTPLDMIQLHGKEAPGRVQEIRQRFSIPVVKALPVGEAADLEAVSAYEPVADWLLFDAKPPKNVAALPGGNGIAFDWKLLAGRRFARPWMLSGGLNAGNLAEAVEMTGATTIDVSSGVEDRPGHKSVEKIRTLLTLAKTLGNGSARPSGLGLSLTGG
jgi:phosphoribosylanthranilate isomerase